MWILLLALSTLLDLAPADEDPLVVEVEHPTTREPGDNSFARPHPMPWASGRQAVIRFHGPGRCTYAIDVPRTGTWNLWLRYAANASVSVAAGFVGSGEELPTHALEASGGLEGKHAWAWARLYHGELAAGRHRIALEGAPFRPDCLLLTQEAGTPTHAAPPPIPAYDEATRALLERPLVAPGTSWRSEFSAWRLPEWYDETRLCMHTRLSPRWLLRPQFTHAAESFAALGARSFVRHVKSGGEGAWWPSAVGPREMWASSVDVAQGIVDRAHAAHCRFIAYYRHMEDEGMAERRPQWRCLDDRGDPIVRRSGRPWLCFNSPYADFVETRLLELVDRGVDGIYFDEMHMPNTGCWCAYCREAFTAATGLEHPARCDEEDPRWRKLQDFTALSIENTFRRWRRVLHGRDPELVMLVGSYRVPTLLDRHLSERLLGIADSVKTEFAIGDSARVAQLFRDRPEWREPPRDVRLALGWDWCRDAADGRPPHVWINGLTDPTEALLATAAVVAHGGIANLDHDEESLPDAELFGEAVGLGNSLGELLHSTAPVRWAGIHVPERTRNRLAPDRIAMWEAGYGAVLGAYETLLRERLPVGLVSDSQLAAGMVDGYRVLFLPTPADLSAAMREEVARFRAEGGVVVEQDPRWQWHTKDGFEGARAALLDAVAALRGELPVAVVGGPETLHAHHRTRRDSGVWVVLLVNDFAWVLERGSRASDPRPPATGVEIHGLVSRSRTSVPDLGSPESSTPAGLPTEPVFRAGTRATVELGPFPVVKCVPILP